ncbi:hypothetical protein ACWGJ0_35970 [Streptomyces massasporeus]
MTMDAADRARIIEVFEEIARIMRFRVGRKGTKLAVLAERLNDAFPSEEILHMVMVVSEHLGRDIDRLALSIGSHAQVTRSVEPLNQGVKVWTTAYLGPAQGHSMTRNVVVEIEQQAAYWLLDSHHLVEGRMIERYAAELGVGYGTPPDYDKMITIAIPRALHGGHRYVPLDGQSKRLKKIRKSLPPVGYNLSDRLEAKFDNVYLSDPNNTFPKFLKELSEWYKNELPDLYPEITLPNGEEGGIRAGLLKIAADTKNPESLIAP